MILAERAARLVSEIAVERLKLEVARLRRERFGASSERSARIDQLELTLEDLEETLAETEAQATAEPEAGATTAFSRRKPARRPLPEHLPRERVVHPGPTDSDMNPADGERAQRQLGLIALGHYGEAADIASAVAYLASPAARFVTGASLSVDGGFAA